MLDPAMRACRQAAIVAAAMLIAGLAHGQGGGAEPAPDRAEASPTQSETLLRAKELNNRGLTMLDSGDEERALAYFRQSRALYPSSRNIANEAICLQRLGRFDEALDVYETLLTQYVDGLSQQDQTALRPVMAGLREKIGRIWVSTNVDKAVVLIDGKRRGELPRKEPLRALPGERRVRVVAAGYNTFEASVTVRAGERVQVDAKLHALKEVGRLRVEDESGQAAKVFVDGVDVGPAPWEGLLQPGEHRVWLRRGELGSRLLTVTILEGQIALVRAKATVLGAPIRIVAQPRTATIEIDGIAVGSGGWEGRLAEGDHSVEVFEAGYHSQTTELVSRKDDAPALMTIKLPVDRDHPRWPSPPIGDLWLEAFAGYAGGPTLGSGAEQHCPSACSNEPWVNGLLAGGRVGFRFPFELSVELNGGYLWLGTSVERTLHGRFGPSGEYPISYQLEDRLAVRGPFVGPGASYRIGLSDRFAMVARLSLMVLFSVSSDDVSGSATTAGSGAPVIVSANEPQRSVSLFVMPSLGGELRVGPIDLGLALGAAFFPLDGPDLPNQRLSANASGPGQPGSISDAPATDAIANERSHGPFGLLIPQLSAQYAFE